ncbi:phosphohistidine swiveling domain-containing protein [Rubricella aquisinus]|uniref:Phosphohistidine swiveling domain-containing protein n=1 Tax=Rubricella aquisinus TaxID=2028108 RepID=A0A840WKL6_9RHOB|nr:PEP/pyruvate-binding domain-containing protein [Rubricella aquisinus]MBB5515638.1 phosphohistidine swiveling domain-containing protein [Rubricella aquisinus]
MTDTPRFTFGTKAETLALLAPLVTTAMVPPVHVTRRDAWVKDRDGVLAAIAARFAGQRLAVRSSALSEDAAESSMAGAFLSLLDVPTDDPAQLAQAMDQVSASMTARDGDQILVQPMIGDIAVSGVIMTFDMASGAPYYRLDFDDETGRPDVVTSGTGVHKSLYVHRDTAPAALKSERVARFIALARELEAITGSAALDIEFCMTRGGDLVLLQVRRIVLARHWHPVIERRVRRELAHLEAHLTRAFAPQPGLLGQGTAYGVMPDWNPAEIIGTTPRPLATSLYHDLITGHVWHEARAEMGYRALPRTPLMTVLHTHPFIDVRASFNSFLPAGLADTTGAVLVDAWIARLKAQPEFHDKVEFEIVPTCMSFDFDAQFQARYPGLLAPQEFDDYRAALIALTRDNLDPARAGLERAIAEAQTLLHHTAPRGGDGDGAAHLGHAVRLINACRSHGTRPFAKAARHAFIAESLLRSAVARGALSADRLAQFRRAIQTYSSTMMADFEAVHDGQMTQPDFFARYGHLRPGTYDVTSLRYDEREDLFADKPAAMAAHVATFTATDAEHAALSSLLSEAGLDVLTAEAFFDYAARAIAAREDVKFIFTRALSDALLHLRHWGLSNGLSADDVSFLRWPEIADLTHTPVLEDLDRHFLPIANARRQDMVDAATIRLPHLITAPGDIYVATLNRSVPNFVGSGRVVGTVSHISADSPPGADIRGRIVCISNADPGFDWIFAKGPAALVTRFGGMNSHMAVRCAELGVPAAIGCGDQVFERIAAAAQVELNCAEKIIRPVHGR